MGVPEILMLFLAAISLAVALNHVFLAIRMSGSLLHFSIALAGLVAFAYFVLVFSGYTSAVDISRLGLIYRYHLVLMQASFFCLLLAFRLLYPNTTRKWTLGVVISFFILVLVSLTLPGRLLFGEDISAALPVIMGSPLTVLAGNTFVWRLLASLAVLVYAYFLISHIINQFIRKRDSHQVAWMIGSILLLVSGALDFLSETQNLNLIYVLPFGHFILFGILSSKSLENFLEDLRTSNQIAMEERKWRGLISDAKVIVVELNTLGQVKYANPYLCKITGYSEEEIMGKDWFELVLSPEYSYDVQSTFLEVLSQNFHSIYENPILSKSGQEFMISWYNVRVKDANGKITGSISIGVDISEHNDKIQKLEAALQEARALISRLEKG